MEAVVKKHTDAKKKDGTLKAKYKDEPRFQAIHGYEDSFKNKFKTLSQLMAKDLVKEVVNIVKLDKNK